MDLDGCVAVCVTVAGDIDAMLRGRSAPPYSQQSGHGSPYSRLSGDVSTHHSTPPHTWQPMLKQSIHLLPLQSDLLMWEGCVCMGCLVCVCVCLVPVQGVGAGMSAATNVVTNFLNSAQQMHRRSLGSSPLSRAGAAGRGSADDPLSSRTLGTQSPLRPRAARASAPSSSPLGQSNSLPLASQQVRAFVCACKNTHMYLISQELVEN